MDNDTYGRSPAMEVLPDIIEAQRLDRADLEDGSPEAIKRLCDRRRGVWALTGLTNVRPE